MSKQTNKKGLSHVQKGERDIKKWKSKERNRKKKEYVNRERS